MSNDKKGLAPLNPPGGLAFTVRPDVKEIRPRFRFELPRPIEVQRYPQARPRWTARDAYRATLDAITEVEPEIRQRWREGDPEGARRVARRALIVHRRAWGNRDIPALDMNGLLSEMLSGGRTPSMVSWVEWGAPAPHEEPHAVGTWDDFVELALEVESGICDVDTTLRIYGAGGAWFVGRFEMNEDYESEWDWEWRYIEPRRICPRDLPPLERKHMTE